MKRSRSSNVGSGTGKRIRSRNGKESRGGQRDRREKKQTEKGKMKKKEMNEVQVAELMYKSLPGDFFPKVVQILCLLQPPRSDSLSLSLSSKSSTSAAVLKARSSRTFPASMIQELLPTSCTIKQNLQTQLQRKVTSSMCFCLKSQVVRLEAATLCSETCLSCSLPILLRHKS